MINPRPVAGEQPSPSRVAREHLGGQAVGQRAEDGIRLGECPLQAHGTQRLVIMREHRIEAFPQGILDGGRQSSGGHDPRT